MKSPRDEYSRTVCGCPSCCKPCSHMPGYLIPGDFDRIAAATGLGDKVLGKLRASPGAVVGSINSDGEMSVFRIPTIVPALENGKCVFLDDAGKCSIHAVAPYGCSHFDWHMDEPTARERSTAGLISIMRSPDYLGMHLALHACGLVSDGPEVKRKNLEESNVSPN